MSARTLENPNRANLFTPLRVALALMVAVPHAFLVPAGVELSPTGHWIAHNLAAVAVDGFFILSGFLIAKSLESRGELISYFVSRGLRIFPALIAMSLLGAFVIGPALTDLSPGAYFADARTWTFPFEMSLFINPEASLPGLFTDAANTRFSIPTWTLRYEAIAYVGAALAFSIGLWRNRRAALIVLGVSILAYVAMRLPGAYERMPSVALALTRFGFAFALGGAVYFWRDKVQLRASWLAAMLPFCLIALWLAPAGAFIASAVFGYALFLVGYSFDGAAERFRHAPDISYGLYIWHVPLMKIVIEFIPTASPLLLLAIGLPVAAIAAYLSWTLIEKPALRAKPYAGELARRIAARRNRDRAPSSSG